MRNSRQSWLRLGAALVVVMSFARFGCSAEAVRTKGFADFPIFLNQATIFLETGHLYRSVDDLSAYGPGTAIYKYPPIYAMLLLPVAGDGAGRWVYDGHWLLQLVLYLLAAALAAWALRPPQWRAFAATAAVVALHFEPFFETLFGLQVDTLVLLLLVICLIALQRRREPVAGVSLALCGMLKVYPAFLVAYLIVKRSWVAIGWCAVACVVIVAACVLVVGIRENVVYFGKILPYLLQEVSSTSVENQGLGRFLQNWFGLAPTVAKRVGQLLVFPAVVISILAVKRHRTPAEEPQRAGLEFSLFIAVMLLYLPNSWANYQLLLLIPLLALLGHGFAKRRHWPLALGAAGTATLWTLFSENAPPVYGVTLVPQPFFDAIVHARMFATAIVWGALAMILLAARGEEPAAGTPVE